MTERMFQICAPGVDVNRIAEEVQAAAAEKMRRGCRSDDPPSSAQRMNLANLKDEESFMTFYLDCLRDTAYVDIADFEIHDRRARFRGVFVAVKRFVWKLLKFYTYRLWSQQNQVNGLLLSALETLESRYAEKIRQLDVRVRDLEARSGKDKG